MNLQRPKNRQARLIAACTVCFGVFVTQAIAAPGTPPAPHPTILPSATKPHVESHRAAHVRATPDVPSSIVGQAHNIDRGRIVQMRDIATAAPPQLGDAPRFHVQGATDAPLTGISDASMRTFPLVPAHPPTLDSVAENSRSAGELRRTFEGTRNSQTGTTPPDTNLAVGPQYIVEVVNSGFSIYSKMGRDVRGYRSFENFLAGNFPNMWAGRTFDPRIVYDPNYEKFVMLILGKDEDAQISGYWIAVSENSDPRGNWCIRAKNATDNTGSSTAWLDFAGLGTDAFGVYVTGNYIYFSGGFRGGALHTFPAEMMTSCNQVNGAIMRDIQWPNGVGQAQSMQPAQAHSQNADEETFFVNTHRTFGNTVMLSRLSGDRGNNPTLTSVAIATPTYGAIGNQIDQPDTLVDIDGGKSTPLSAVYAEGRVYFALTTEVLNDGRASGWLLVELDTETNTRVWDHLLWHGEGRYLFYPALTLQGGERNNNLAVFGGLTDTETFLTPATAYATGYSVVYDDRPNSNAQHAAVIASGSSHYEVVAEDGRNRWGDYSGAAYDWTCGYAWGSVQSATGSTDWSTTIASLDFAQEPACPQLFVTSPVLAQPVDSSGNLLITWESENLPVGDETYVFIDSDDIIPIQIAGPLDSGITQLVWPVLEMPGDSARVIVGSYDGSEYSALHYSDPFVINDVTPPSPSPLVWQNPPTATSTSAIAMSTSAVDGSGGLVQYLFDFVDSPNGGLSGADRDWAFAAVYQNTNLWPNYQYCYRAVARDSAFNLTAYAQDMCAFTFANPPLPDGFSEVRWNYINVVAGRNANSDATEYLFQNLTTGELSGWQAQTSWHNNGLQAFTTYQYRARSRNGDGIVSVWVDMGSATTPTDDADGDGLPAAMDNCLDVVNPAQRDTDGDNIGNLCDFDLSQDCIVNAVDLGMFRLRFFSANADADFNGDGVVNVVDLGLLRTGFFQVAGPSGLANACSGGG